MEPWSKKEQEIIDIIKGQDDESLRELKRMAREELDRGNESMSFAFDQICRELARRTVEAIRAL